MMIKKLNYILATGLLFIFTTCQTAQQVSTTAYTGTPIAMPEIPFDKPTYTLDHLSVIQVPEEEEYDFNKVDITEYFSANDRYQVQVTDPKLFAYENTLMIHLSRINEEEYAFPLPGAKVISEYAGRRRNHTGVDLKVSRRDTIVSAFDGIVRLAMFNPTYGNVIVVRHYNGLETVYSHNTKNFVKSGDRVKAGEPIATSGQTGRASTDHLHFETRINGQHFNPALLFNYETQKLHDTKSLLAVKNGSKIVISQVDPTPYYASVRNQEESGREG